LKFLSRLPTAKPVYDCRQWEDAQSLTGSVGRYASLF
jgi:hypothetical protein